MSQPPEPVQIAGGATSEEVAAVVAVLACLGGDEQAPARARRSTWAEPIRSTGGRQPAPGGWVQSGLPG